MTNDLQLLDQCLADADDAMAAIIDDVDQSMPGPNHAMWASAGRRNSKSKQSPADSILNAPRGAEEVVECNCLPDGVQTLRQEPRIDLAAGVLRCATCGSPIGKSSRSKRIVHMRRILALHQTNPAMVNVADLQDAGWLL